MHKKRNYAESQIKTRVRSQSSYSCTRY